MSPEDLAAKFPIKSLKFERGQGGLIKVLVCNSFASGEIYLHGAHVTQYQPAGAKPVLWMSGMSMFEEGKPIRGGVPICFPWFGPLASNPVAPGHGYARIREWTLVAAEATDDGATALTLQTTIDHFELSYRVTWGRELSMALSVKLCESSSQAATFEEALHTYFAISDIKRIRIEGLESTGYIDKVDNATKKPASGQPIRFDGECDRVYLDTQADCLLHDEQWQRTITVSKAHSHSTVVWNPWVNKSAKMADFGDNEWPGMVCIETANVGPNAIKLSPGESHTMNAEISL